MRYFIQFKKIFFKNIYETLIFSVGMGRFNIRMEANLTVNGIMIKQMGQED